MSIQLFRIKFDYKGYLTTWKQLLYVLDTINDSISDDKKISFNNNYGTDFKLHPRREEPYIVNLYQMVANNGKHYLVYRKISFRYIDAE